MVIGMSLVIFMFGPEFLVRLVEVRGVNIDNSEGKRNG